MAAGVEEPNALMQVGARGRSDTNQRATEIELYEGLNAYAVNCWPSVHFDLGGLNGLFSRFIPAGFYYKTFMWPNWGWFEPLIRRAAGLGKAPVVPDADRYETRFAHCDVLVVGAGAAGLAAAVSASRSGARVMMCEQLSEVGGRLLWDAAHVDGEPGAVWVRRQIQALQSLPEAMILTRTTALGYFDHNALTLLERVTDDLGDGAPAALPRQRVWQVRAKQVILATGAMERPLVFPGNDRPGVMLASAVHEYLGRFGVRAGDTAVVFTNNVWAYAVLPALQAAGVKIAAVVDARPESSTLNEPAQAGPPVLRGAVVVKTRGRHGLRAVKLREHDGRERWVKADLLAMSGGLNPTVQLFRQSGGGLGWSETLSCFKPEKSVQAEVSVGAAAGVFSLAAALHTGHHAGEQAAEKVGFAVEPSAAPDSANPSPTDGAVIAPLWRVAADGKAFVDFQNDVTVADIELSARENFVSVEHLKRYTTLGMGTDQGKTANVNALAVMSSLTGKTIQETGSTLYRFPFTPIAFGALGGRSRGALFRPIRQLAAAVAHERAGAIFEEYGGFMRPAYYPKDGETPYQAEQREVRAVRKRAGLFDASPLGKIEVVGPDAGVFLDRIYANTMSTLKVGKCRYGLMLNELGVIIDDGVTVRMSEDRFLVGTTGGGAARIAAWLEEWLQCEWPHLKVLIAPVTSAWAVITLSGPVARAILDKVGVENIDLSQASFPHMSFREGGVAGVPARISRVSFTGEVSFEVSVPARQAQALWSQCLDVGRPLGLEPVGVDAWMALRTEKGFLHVGADTDGSTTPDDVGWGHVLKRKQDFIGRRSLDRPEALRRDRLQLVGLKVTEASAPSEVLAIGSHVQGKGGSDGYVTSAAFSASLGRGVALARVRAGRARMGEEVTILAPSGRRCATITELAAYDPEGVRLHD